MASRRSPKGQFVPLLPWIHPSGKETLRLQPSSLEEVPIPPKAAGIPTPEGDSGREGRRPE